MHGSIYYCKITPVPEFDLIERYFKPIPIRRKDVVKGIGDDCAILEVPQDRQLVTSTDTLVSGVHFPEETLAEDVGYKALAVNLSDLAAMGAEPAWVSLALTMPDENYQWLAGFVKGFSELAEKYNVQLIGGDTTKGPLSITVQIYGFIQKNKTLCRDAAKPGDLVYITGVIGDAGLGLKKLFNNLNGLEKCVNQLNRPVPRVEVAQALTKISCCAIDISDGLLADLGHIAKESQCAAVIERDKIPLSKELQSFYGNDIDWQQVLASGDDYELCFTINEQNQDKINKIQSAHNVLLTCIGEIKAGHGVCCTDLNGQELDLSSPGYNHF
jgi:thiamine-monophosphate kinase